MRSSRLSLAALLALTFVVACGASEDPDVPELEQGTVRVTSREQSVLDVSALAPIKLGSNDLAVVFSSARSAAETELVQASALMPAHGHGSKPPVIEKVDGGYRVRALVLYMSGRWEVRLTLRTEGREDEALFTVDVP